MVHLVLAFSFRWLSSWSWIMLFSSENSILLGWLWSLDWSHKQKHSQHFGNEHYDMFYSSSPPLAWYCTSLAPSMFLSHGRKRAWYIILFFRSHIKKDLFLLMAQDKSVSSIHFPPLPPPKKTMPDHRLPVFCLWLWKSYPYLQIQLQLFLQVISVVMTPITGLWLWFHC